MQEWLLVGGSLAAFVIIFLLGVLTGRAFRGYVSQWCSVHGTALACPTCAGLRAVSPSSTVCQSPPARTDYAALLTPGARERSAR